MFKRIISWLISVILIFLSGTVYADQFGNLAQRANGQGQRLSAGNSPQTIRSRTTTTQRPRSGANGPQGDQGALGRAGSYPRPAAASSPATTTRLPSLHTAGQQLSAQPNRPAMPTQDVTSAEYSLELGRTRQDLEIERARHAEAVREAEESRLAAAAARAAQEASERNAARITKVDSDYNSGDRLLREVIFRDGQTDVDDGSFDDYKIYRVDVGAVYPWNWYCQNYWAMEGGGIDWDSVEVKLKEWMGEEKRYSFLLKFEAGTGNIGDNIQDGGKGEKNWNVIVKMNFEELMGMLIHQDPSFD